MPKPRRGRGKAKEVKGVLRIYCEGAKTEPNYIQGYLNKYHPANRTLKVVKVESTKKNTPVQLVEEAEKKKKSAESTPNDEYWAVYDRERIAKYSNELHRKTLDKANAKGINVALSNVCFEVWILLHFIDVRASYSDCDDLIKRSPLKSELKKVGIDDYDKSDSNIFEVLSENITVARKRALAMNSSTLQASPETEYDPHKLNPYTGVYKLLDAVDRFIESNK